jgi:selenocysteine lyase/cysteine desulfurase
MLDPVSVAFRAEFPVLDRVAYFNAGTNGPVPRRAVDAAAAWMRRDLGEGRSGAERFDELNQRTARLRARLASFLGCDASEVALTRSTTDGVNAALALLDLGPGDEVLTTDEEHPGLLAPLAARARRRGFEVREAPFGAVADAVSEKTSLVACSHVSWLTGQLVEVEALKATGVRLLLDGAQGLGAIALDMRELGCDFYAASGQKWLCGPEGSGCLYVRAGALHEMQPPWPGYQSLADPAGAVAAAWHRDARRYDTVYPPGHHVAWSLAALDTLEGPGRDWVQERGTTLAARLAELLAEGGAEVAPRGRTTLVTWRDDDPETRVKQLAEHSIAVRAFPGRPYVRAAVGAWSTAEELERLAELALSA